MSPVRREGFQKASVPQSAQSAMPHGTGIGKIRRGGGRTISWPRGVAPEAGPVCPPAAPMTPAIPWRPASSASGRHRGVVRGIPAWSKLPAIDRPTALENEKCNVDRRVRQLDAREVAGGGHDPLMAER